MWYRNQEGKQFLKIALPNDAWSMSATIKTKKGIHKVSLDRWGDSTHKMSAYNHRHKPSFRDQRQMDRMEGESMVLYPTIPNPVLPRRSPGFSGGRGMYPRGTGGIASLNWRAEGLRAPNPGFGAAYPPECEQCPSTSGAFYRQQKERVPLVTRRKYSRKSPSRSPHRRAPNPPSPQYKSATTSEDEGEQLSAARGSTQTLH